MSTRKRAGWCDSLPAHDMAEYSKIKIADIENNEGQIEGVKANPRSIDEGDYKKLLNSLRESDLTDILPLKVYPYKGKYVTIGGNMRLRALRELGVKEVQCIVIPEDTSTEVLNKAIILDNSTHGEWDWDMIANEWGDMPLDMWGVDVPASGEAKEKEEKHSEKVNSLITYEIVFNSEQEQDEWYKYLNELKKKYTELYTISERIIESIKEWRTIDG